MSATFSPAPGAAPYATMVAAQARMELRLLLRNGEQLLLALVIPVLALVGGVLGAERLGLDLGGRPVDVVTPGVMALAVISTAFTSLAIATGFERRYGVLKRLGTSPLPRSGLLLGKAVALLGVLVLQFVVIAGVAVALGWRPAGSLAALPLVLSGTFAFAALGMLVAGALRAEATLALANLVFLLLMAGGGSVLPTSVYGTFGDIARFLPSGALGDGLRSALIDGSLDPSALVVLLGWGAVAALLAGRTFSWE